MWLSGLIVIGVVSGIFFPIYDLGTGVFSVGNLMVVIALTMIWSGICELWKK